MFKWSSRLVTISAIAGLLTLNVLTLVSDTVFGALSGALESLAPEIETNAARFNKERASARALAERQRVAARSLKQRIYRRTARLASIQAIEVGNSYVPFVGSTAVMSISLWEMKEMCAGLNEMNEYLNTFEIDTSVEDRGILDKACNPTLPNFSETMDATLTSLQSIVATLGFTSTEDPPVAAPTSDDPLRPVEQPLENGTP